MNSAPQPKPQIRIPNRIGVVIITYQSQSEIATCLKSLAGYDCDVVVVDNGSCDETVNIARAFPVELLANKENRGFAAAANQGFAALDNDWILLLNPDVSVTAGFASLFNRECPGDTGVVTGMLSEPDGTPQSQFQFRRFPSPLTLLFETIGLNRIYPGNPINRRYRYHDRHWEETHLVEQPAGAFLLILRRAWQAVGRFDELFYPLWFEDVDFCLRLWQDGWKILYLPVHLGYHTGAHSIRHLEPGFRQLYWYRSLLRYAEKHFSVVWVRILALSVGVALGGKSLMMALQLGHRGQRQAVWPAMKMALQTLIHGRHPIADRAR